MNELSSIHSHNQCYYLRERKREREIFYKFNIWMNLTKLYSTFSVKIASQKIEPLEFVNLPQKFLKVNAII